MSGRRGRSSVIVDPRTCLVVGSKYQTANKASIVLGNADIIFRRSRVLLEMTPPLDHSAV